MQNAGVMRPEVRADYERAATRVHGDDAFANRFERFFTQLRDPLTRLYGADRRFPAQWDALLDAIAATAAQRDPELRRLDHEREITVDWLQREQAVGYVAYVDRFAGTLNGVRERLPYLRELGVSYLHLMPLLQARPSPNDGGYAVVDYGAVEPALGTMDDLRALAADLRGQDMALCVDVVLNHTAREHPWAQAALAGDLGKLAYYRTFDDRAEPDAYEATMPDVFPDTAPGSFTWVPELGRWVWTTFNDYQWDLDYSNPEVFVELARAMLGLAAAGVDVLRLDAVPFLWKRLGTDGQNQPEVHELLAAFRAVLRIAAPAVAFKAEAIVSPRELVAYLGVGRHEGQECDLAYHNALMVLLWSSLASRRVALLTKTLQSMPPTPPTAGWATYVRCHDDIGWAITDADASAVGEDAALHRRFLSAFYAGEFPGSFARGERFQPQPDGEARISGTAASLAGVQDDPELGVRRVLLLYAVAFAFGGLPLIYMGDELGLRNDASYRDDPDRAADNRWMHRPAMDWDAAARRHDPATVEGRLWAGLRELVDAARRHPRRARLRGPRGLLDRQRARLRPAPRARRRDAHPAGELLRRAADGGRRRAGALRLRVAEPRRPVGSRPCAFAPGPASIQARFRTGAGAVAAAWRSAAAPPASSW